MSEDIDVKLVKERIKELFAGETQEKTGRKIGIQQEDVSRMLQRETHLPRVDTLYRIAKAYGVSADWILGLTDKKEPEKMKGTYATAVNEVFEMVDCGISEYYDEGNQKPITLTINDPFMKALLRKAVNLSDVDRKYLKQWKEDILSRFDDKPLLYFDAWKDKRVRSDAEQTSTEDQLAHFYEEAKTIEDEWFELAANIHD